MSKMRNSKKNLLSGGQSGNWRYGLITAALVLVVMIASGLTTRALLSDTTETIDNVFQTAPKHILVYHANTGSEAEDAKVTVPPTQTEYGEGEVTFAISTDIPTRDGFVFAGWYLDTEHTGDEITGNYTTEAKTTDLYAKWEAGYTLIYDANDGKGIPNITVSGSEKTANGKVTVVSGEPSYTFSQLATQGAMTGPVEADETSDHRVFLGWSTDKNATEPAFTRDGKLAYTNETNDYDGSKVDGFDKEVKIIAADNPSKTVTLYAVWATKYELSFKYHPEMVDPKCGDATKLQKPMTLVSASNKAPTFTLIKQDEADAQGYTPTREEGYRWGWWGDNLERFKFSKPGEGQSAAQAGNEGCYQFGEPVPARTESDKTAKAPNWDDPALTLYAYFQPPSACSMVFDDNTANTRQFPEYADRNNTYKVTNMPDNAGASTTETVWKKTIPSGEENTPVHPRYTFIGWSEDKDAADPEYQPGDEVNLNKVIKNKVTLYAIWKPMHTYRITFNRGYKNSRGNLEYTGTNEYYVQTSSRQWKRGGYNIWFDSDTTEYEVTGTKYITDTSYTWPAGFFNKRGFFTTKDDDSVGTYKFLGWSWDPQEPSTDEEALMSKVAFPVTIPDDPSSILNTSPDGSDTTGTITEAITVEEGTPCTKPTRHDYTLYAVYRKSPLHQLRVEFVKGNADTVDYKGTQDGNTDIHLIDIDGVRQSKDKYYASLDYPSYTWNAAYWADHTPSATKNDDKDGTATYTFLGWSTNENHKTPSATITKNDIDYPVDDNGHITEPITVSEEAAEAKDCVGGIHKVTLYPVFKKNPRHVYELTYDANVPSTAAGIENKVYRLENGNWVEQKDNQDKPITKDIYDRQIKELTDTHYEWDLSGAGLFASCVNTGSTPTGEYTFLGWSYTKYDIRKNPYKPGESPAIEFPITAPADPANPGSGEGVFGQDSTVLIDTDEQTPKPADACTFEKGEVHTKPLYGVWAGEPLHQYSVIFTGVEKDTSIVYGSSADWTAEPKTTQSASETVSKTRKNADNINVPVKYYDLTDQTEKNLTADVKYAYRVFSDPMPMPKEDPNKTDSFTFDARFWKDNSDPSSIKDLIVKAERKADANTRYEFDGWYTEPNGGGTKVDVDPNGYITSSFTIKDTHYGHTDSESGQFVIDCDSDTHNLILYADWKEVKIHDFQLIFSNIDATELGYMDNGTWKRGTNTTVYKTAGSSPILNNLVDPTQADFIPYSFYGDVKTTDKYDAEDVNQRLSYSWGESGDSGQKLRVMASKNKDDNAEYEFVGWSTKKIEPSETNSPADADYTVDADGYVQEKITITDPDIDSTDPESACAHPTHTLVLYPVFKRIPIHNFSVTLDLNGGSALRAYNAGTGKWSNSTTYTYYKPEGTSSSVKKRVSETDSKYIWGVDDFWSKNGFGAYKNYDSYYTYEFVGWSRTKKDISENPDTSSGMVGWSKDSVEYASNSEKDQMTPYVNGFINENIEVKCDNDPCTGGSHNVKLYAVWKRTPRTKTYTLKFDANGGVNAPASKTQTVTYDGTTAWNSSSYTLTNQMITDAGMKNKQLVFVGWHENANADQGKYGESNNANEELEQLTQGLTNPYKIENDAATTDLSKYKVEKTLYAIWWLEYRLDYDANGGSGGPEHEHVYTSDNYYSFRISNDKPTHSSGYEFLGWSETQVTPGQGTEADVQFKASTPAKEVRFGVNAAGSPSDDNYGYTGKKLYAVWGPKQ